jgi:hypothetical protein
MLYEIDQQVKRTGRKSAELLSLSYAKILSVDSNVVEVISGREYFRGCHR